MIKPKLCLVRERYSVLEILVYEEIGEDYWSGTGVTAAAVTAAIKAAGAFDKIVVRINSPGGSCFEGVAIYNLLRSQGKPIDVFVDGLAASAASVIAMAGDTINVGTGAMIMIHNAACWGRLSAMLRHCEGRCDVIENISTTVGGIYVNRTGNDAATVKALMDAETWMNGGRRSRRASPTKVVSRTQGEDRRRPVRWPSSST
jgi:ATP-dependent Clp protease protease subunit